MENVTPAVLVLDDEEDLRMVLVQVVEEALQRPGVALAVEDNVEGLDELLRAERPLVVVLDRFMGPLPFDVLLEILAADAVAEGAFGGRLRRHCYVVLTASPQSLSDHERRLLARELDGAPVVGKPFDIEDLETVLRDAMRRLERREQERRESERRAAVAGAAGAARR